MPAEEIEHKKGQTAW